MAPLTPLEIWPLFGIRVRTPRLELRPVDDALAYVVANLAAEGVHDPDTMPFMVPWTDAEPPDLQRNTVRHFWQTWATFEPDRWNLPFAVSTLDADGRPDTVVGIQAVHEAKEFPILRTFETGSWLGQAHQGQGIGKEMRSAVLHFMFAGLGAEEATTGAFSDNPRSLAVTRALGYEPNGEWRFNRRGKMITDVTFRMPHATWDARRRDDISIEGLDEACLALFGLGPDRQPLPAAPA